MPPLHSPFLRTDDGDPQERLGRDRENLEEVIHFPPVAHSILTE